MLDYPYVRASNVCPLCRRHKDQSLVACWPCYHGRGMRYGNNEVEEVLKQTETRLAAGGEHRAEVGEPERI